MEYMFQDVRTPYASTQSNACLEAANLMSFNYSTGSRSFFAHSDSSFGNATADTDCSM
jgi:hypothetical protein